jgi:hypothetical protein
LARNGEEIDDEGEATVGVRPKINLSLEVKGIDSPFQTSYAPQTIEPAPSNTPVTIISSLSERTLRCNSFGATNASPNVTKSIERSPIGVKEISLQEIKGKGEEEEEVNELDEQK